MLRRRRQGRRQGGTIARLRSRDNECARSSADNEFGSASPQIRLATRRYRDHKPDIACHLPSEPISSPNGSDQWLAAKGLSTPLGFIASPLHRVVTANLRSLVMTDSATGTRGRARSMLHLRLRSKGSSLAFLPALLCSQHAPATSEDRRCLSSRARQGSHALGTLKPPRVAFCHRRQIPLAVSNSLRLGGPIACRRQR